MGIGGSAQRRAQHCSRSPAAHRYDDPPRSHNVSRNVSALNVGPRIVVPATTYIDRSNEYEVMQCTSARSLNYGQPKQTSSMHSRIESRTCDYDTSTQFAAPLPLPPPPFRSPDELCNCKACKAKDEALAASLPTSSAATSTYVPPNQCSRSTITQPRATATPARAYADCASSYSNPQRNASNRNLNTCPTCGTSTSRAQINCSAERPVATCSNRNSKIFAAPSTRIHQTAIATQTEPQKPAHSGYDDAAAIPSGGATSDCTTDFQQECLEAHNRFRARHQNCPVLTLSSDLSRYAQQWAKHLASSGRLEHRQVHTYGENLYTSRGMEVNGSTAVKSWYDEVRYYDFSKPNYKPGTGHFTQVVWRESRQLGVGIATRGDTTYVVCNYNPPGNIIGSFDSMVPPLK
ncbi:uncharacterized protein LOC129248489 [Anastrepha obliqua]|uniref:uncharacterized protein LOC129248489 n=1 Tax=Anastrepha obliqua TaxID=95512 RepID=UPI002409E80F|nr:uncharacterized protein LOC129248489 [Anastrepha obliqua]